MLAWPAVVAGCGGGGADGGDPPAPGNTFRTLQTGVARAAHTATLLPDGRVLMMGGEDNTNALPSAVLAFDPTQERFSALGELATGRLEHTATALADGTVLVMGGLRGLSASPIAERFNPATRQSRATTGQPQSTRMYHTATVLADGRVLFAGGQSSGTSGAAGFLDAVDVFDPASDRFARLTMRLAVPRIGHNAMLITSNLVMLYGGLTAQGTAAPPELMDLGAQESSTMAAPAHDKTLRKHAVAVTTTANDTVVLGGEGVDDAPLASVALVLIGGLSLRDGGKLATPRVHLAAAALADGRVLVTGGNATATSRALATTELYSPSQRASTPGPNLAAARFNHTATALANGKVLVFGGNGADNGVLSSAEVFG